MGDRLGVLPHIIEAVLNHVSGHRAEVAGVYNLARYEAEMRAALTAWADYVDGIVRGIDKIAPQMGGLAQATLHSSDTLMPSDANSSWVS